jgi:hypothetical protein
VGATDYYFRIQAGEKVVMETVVNQRIIKQNLNWNYDSTIVTR